MDDPEKVAAYTRAGREDGVMAPVYLFHAAQISEVVRPGDTVIDLGCGPATQLAMVARLNPDCHFIGLDLSDEMLRRARAHIAEQGLQNVEFRETDITDLSAFEDGGIDAAMSTMVLHHLPDVAALEKTFAEVSRVVRPDGGLYLVDFGHLKSETSINYFAYQYADRQPELFTLDYLYSLRAAFDREDFKRLAETYLAGRAKFYSTFIMPFMVAVKSAPRAQNTALVR
ncbi:MAG: class I SAM-dependent methyltransferase, partial [Candidatus Zixiibacteriota bacterium]